MHMMVLTITLFGTLNFYLLIYFKNWIVSILDWMVPTLHMMITIECEVLYNDPCVQIDTHTITPSSKEKVKKK